MSAAAPSVVATGRPHAGRPSTSKPLEDYALIGNMISAALVGRDGSIDWLCLPRFDSPACFAALLGNSENGRWVIAPTDAHESKRSYYSGTAILETRFVTRTGEAALIDFMPLTDDETKVDVVRIVRGLRGSVDFEMELVLRFAYGTAVPWVRRRDYGLSAIAGPDAVELHTRAELEGRDLTTRARFSVREGDSVPFTLSYHPSHAPPHFVVSYRSTRLPRSGRLCHRHRDRCHCAARRGVGHS